uniref:U3 small nucleolar RNA-associated protein 18 homolog n=1 Tax=Cyclopterus lumpus TaxID=8103 RepID=A0A8C2ZQ16_CYCLU
MLGPNQQNLISIKSLKPDDVEYVNCLFISHCGKDLWPNEHRQAAPFPGPLPPTPRRPDTPKCCSVHKHKQQSEPYSTQPVGAGRRPSRSPGKTPTQRRSAGAFVDMLCLSSQMKKCLHANSSRPSEDRLTTVQFHPIAQVVMTAGLDQSVSLFQVDGKTNPKIQSIHLERFPVHRAQFSRDGDTVIATSLKNKMFYLYDMMEGRVTPVHTVRGLNEARVKEFSVCPEGGALLLTGTNGYLHLLTLQTKEVIRSMKINGDVVGVAFSHDGSKVFANSEDGEVYVWDMRSSRCVNRFTDEGCVKGTSIAASPNGQYLACGSQSGVVNVYSQEACLNSANPKPLKAVMNLLTSATSMTFNPSSEILAIASRDEDEAVRLVHMSSLTVFSNFPVSKRKIVYRTSCLDFSPHSGFFSLANNKGHAPLFRLLHYKDF